MWLESMTVAGVERLEHSKADEPMPDHGGSLWTTLGTVVLILGEMGSCRRFYAGLELRHFFEGLAQSI